MYEPSASRKPDALSHYRKPSNSSSGSMLTKPISSDSVVSAQSSITNSLDPPKKRNKTTSSAYSLFAAYRRPVPIENMVITVKTKTTNNNNNSDNKETQDKQDNGRNGLVNNVNDSSRTLSTTTSMSHASVAEPFLQPVYEQQQQQQQYRNTTLVVPSSSSSLTIDPSVATDQRGRSDMLDAIESVDLVDDDDDEEEGGGGDNEVPTETNPTSTTNHCASENGQDEQSDQQQQQDESSSRRLDRQEEEVVDKKEDVVFVGWGSNNSSRGNDVDSNSNTADSHNNNNNNNEDQPKPSKSSLTSATTSWFFSSKPEQPEGIQQTTPQSLEEVMRELEKSGLQVKCLDEDGGGSSSSPAPATTSTMPVRNEVGINDARTSNNDKDGNDDDDNDHDEGEDEEQSKQQGAMTSSMGWLFRSTSEDDHQQQQPQNQYAETTAAAADDDNESKMSKRSSSWFWSSSNQLMAQDSNNSGDAAALWGEEGAGGGGGGKARPSLVRGASGWLWNSQAQLQDDNDDNDDNDNNHGYAARNAENAAPPSPASDHPSVNGRSPRPFGRSSSMPPMLEHASEQQRVARRFSDHQEGSVDLSFREGMARRRPTVTFAEKEEEIAAGLLQRNPSLSNNSSDGNNSTNNNKGGAETSRPSLAGGVSNAVSGWVKDLGEEVKKKGSDGNTNSGSNNHHNNATRMVVRKERPHYQPGRYRTLRRKRPRLKRRRLVTPGCKDRSDALIGDKHKRQSRWAMNQEFVGHIFQAYRETLFDEHGMNPNIDDFDAYREASHVNQAHLGAIKDKMLADGHLSEREIACFVEGFTLLSVKLQSLQSQVEGWKSVTKELKSGKSVSKILSVASDLKDSPDALKLMHEYNVTRGVLKGYEKQMEAEGITWVEDVDAWDNANEADNQQALQKILRHMPVNIRLSSEAELGLALTPNGKTLPTRVIKKFKRANVLQLLRISPDDIFDLNPSVLENLRTSGLTLTERRALHSHLRELGAEWGALKSHDPRMERRWLWFTMMRNKFRSVLDAYQRHCKEYGPPCNHPYATKARPNEGCPLVGKNCPVKADKLMDYHGDYGYPDGAVYESQQTNDEEESKTNEEQQEQQSATRDKQRLKDLKKEYSGNSYQAALAYSSCQAMASTMTHISQARQSWAETLYESDGQKANDLNEILRDLRLGLSQLFVRAGMELTDKDEVVKHMADNRRKTELQECERLYYAATDLLGWLESCLEDLQCSTSSERETLQNLRDMLRTLHDRNKLSLSLLQARSSDNNNNKKTGSPKHERHDKMDLPSSVADSERGEKAAAVSTFDQPQEREEKVAPTESAQSADQGDAQHHEKDGPQREPTAGSPEPTAVQETKPERPRKLALLASSGEEKPLRALQRSSSIRLRSRIEADSKKEFSTRLQSSRLRSRSEELTGASTNHEQARRRLERSPSIRRSRSVEPSSTQERTTYERVARRAIATSMRLRSSSVEPSQRSMNSSEPSTARRLERTSSLRLRTRGGGEKPALDNGETKSEVGSFPTNIHAVTPRKTATPRQLGRTGLDTSQRSQRQLGRTGLDSSQRPERQLSRLGLDASQRSERSRSAIRSRPRNVNERLARLRSRSHDSSRSLKSERTEQSRPNSALRARTNEKLARLGPKLANTLLKSSSNQKKESAASVNEVKDKRTHDEVMAAIAERRRKRAEARASQKSPAKERKEEIRATSDVLAAIEARRAARRTSVSPTDSEEKSSVAGKVVEKDRSASGSPTSSDDGEGVVSRSRESPLDRKAALGKTDDSERSGRAAQLRSTVGTRRTTRSEVGDKPQELSRGSPSLSPLRVSRSSHGSGSSKNSTCRDSKNETPRKLDDSGGSGRHARLSSVIVARHRSQSTESPSPRNVRLEKRVESPSLSRVSRSSQESRSSNQSGSKGSTSARSSDPGEGSDSATAQQASSVLSGLRTGQRRSLDRDVPSAAASSATPAEARSTQNVKTAGKVTESVARVSGVAPASGRTRTPEQGESLSSPRKRIGRKDLSVNAAAASPSEGRATRSVEEILAAARERRSRRNQATKGANESPTSSATGATEKRSHTDVLAAIAARRQAREQRRAAAGALNGKEEGGE